MAAVKDVERPDYLYIGSETEVISRMLDHYRSTLLWKCEGLDDDHLGRRSVTPSELSLLELVSHLTGAERYWFQHCVAQRNLTPPTASTEDNPPTAEEIVGNYLAACEESRLVSAAHSFDEIVPSEVYGRPVSHRFIVFHMVGEYARHCGHADLLREAIDGAAGE